MNTKHDIRIDYLANHPEFVDRLAAWTFNEWPEYLIGKSVEDVAESIRQRLNIDRVPLAIVAFHAGQVVGSASLKEHDLDARMDLSPWLGELYVLPSYRQRGIGSSLVRSVLEEARRLGIDHLYLWTPKSEAYYAKRGWSVLERMVYKETNITLMERELA